MLTGSILNFLEEYDKKESIRFHMPGHKGKHMEELSSKIPSFDITEIYGSDNLHFPEGIIRESEIRASKLYGSKEALYMINGSTSSVYSAITGVLSPGEKLLLQRDSHKSAYNAAIIGGIETEYLYPVYDSELELNLGVRPQYIEDKLKEDSSIKAIFMTHPSYYGVCSDVEAVAGLAKKYDKILIVDEAHGSHLKFANQSDKSTPKSAIDLGADIVIHSTHKTLTGFTQTSILHICSDRVDSERIKAMAAIYQSTSPSYILMASLDYTVTLMEQSGKELMKMCLSNLESEIYSKKLKSKEKSYKTPENSKDSFSRGNIINHKDIESKGFKFDKTKIVFSVEGYTGKELESVLRDKYNIELEMSDHKYGIGISTFYDSKEDIKELYKALEEISIEAKELDKSNKDDRQGSSSYMSRKEYSIDDYIGKACSDKVINLREAFYSDKEDISLEKAGGRIAGDMIIPYPPGVPILVPGERIDNNQIEYIKYLIELDINVQGIEKKKRDGIDNIESCEDSSRFGIIKVIK